MAVVFCGRECLGDVEVKKSITYWAFKGGLEGEKDLNAALREAKRFGYEGIELTYHTSCGPLNPSTTQSDCEKILRYADQVGIEISSLASGLHWDYSPTSDDPDVRKQAKAHAKKAIQIANWMKLNRLLYVPGMVDVFFNPSVPVVPYDAVWKRATTVTKALLPTAEKNKVTLCVENVWTKFLYSPLEYRDFIDQFSSKYIKACFDVGNCVLMGYPEQWIRILGKRVKLVHFKDFKAEVGNVSGFCDLGEGSVDWKAVMSALRKTGYRGYCTAEMIPYKPGLVRKTSNTMDKIFNL